MESRTSTISDIYHPGHLPPCGQIPSRTFTIPDILPSPRMFTIPDIYHPGHLPSRTFTIPDFYHPGHLPSRTLTFPDFYHPGHLPSRTFTIPDFYHPMFREQLSGASIQGTTIRTPFKSNMFGFRQLGQIFIQPGRYVGRNLYWKF